MDDRLENGEAFSQLAYLHFPPLCMIRDNNVDCGTEAELVLEQGQSFNRFTPAGFYLQKTR